MEITLQAIAQALGGDLTGEGDLKITGVAPFDFAGPDQITLAGGPKFLKRILETRAGAVIVPRNFQGGGKAVIAVSNPGAAFAKVLDMFHPRPEPVDNISSKAHIGAGFVCGGQVSAGPFAVIGDRVTVGSRVRIHAHVVIGDDVIIGSDVEIYPHVTIYDRCRIGNRVIIHAGTVIGGDGFGFAPDGEKYYKIPQIGIVQIDDDVEIGALNAIDRATFDRTWIQSGVKTDNLIHVAHNVTVGQNTILVAQVGIAGSTTIGRHAVLAGQAGISGHLNIGDNVTIGPQAGIGKDVPDGEILSGSPGIPHKLWLRVQRVFPMLPEMKRRIEHLEKRLEKVEEK
jgi:UDP-3-O-[3-hydroxymyristoyl] glucosamine N-acyltransferase